MGLETLDLRIKVLVGAGDPRISDLHDGPLNFESLIFGM
jgi:hypothetical protein